MRNLRFRYLQSHYYILYFYVVPDQVRDEYVNALKHNLYILVEEAW